MIVAVTGTALLIGAVFLVLLIKFLMWRDRRKRGE